MSNVKLRIRGIIYRTLGAVDWLLNLKKPDVIVICYHSISGGEWRHSIAPNTFKVQLETILRDYSPISTDRLNKYLQGKVSLSKPSFVLTFDDGYRDLLEMRQFLQSKKIKPCLFILSNPTKANRKELSNSLKMLSISEVKLLARSGWDIGSHSATHANLAELDEVATRREVTQSKKQLERVLHIPVKYFSLPRGKYTKVTERVVVESGYHMCFSMDDGIITQKTNPQRVPRIAVDKTHVSTEFPCIYSPSVIRLRRLLKNINLHKLYE